MRDRSPRIKTGLVIGERREKLETASERTAARNKVKRRARGRIIITILGFAAVAAGIICIGHFLINNHDDIIAPTVTTAVAEYTPTIPITDEDAGDDGAHLTARMREYIGQLEADLREQGIIATKAVIPAGAIREVDIYLDGHPGYLKAISDRGSGVTAEDAERVLRYLAEQGITDWQYIDLRLSGKAYWR